MNLQTDKIRNIALVGHNGAGKTSFAEAMLYSTGATNRYGTIQDGTTVSDYHSDEIDRQMSIHATLLSFEYNDMFLNVLDTPGYADFLGDVKGSMRVSDMALFLIDANSGLQIGTERAWKYADEYSLPRIICVNGLDHENVNFEETFGTLQERWGNHVVPLQIPVAEGPNFKSVIDLIRNKQLSWEQGGKGDWSESNIPAELSDQAESYRQQLIETIAESDESLMEKFFDDKLTEDDIRIGLSKALMEREIYPVVCSSATQNVGVKRIVQILSKYGVSPDYKKEIEGKDGVSRESNVSAPASVFIFKTVSEQHVGELSFFRVYSGLVKSGDELRNVNRSANERLNQLFVMNGKNRKDAGQLPAGSIAAVVKLKNTHTGDTLAEAKEPITYKPTEYPLPNIHFAMVPATRGDEEKFSTALSKIHEEDPTFVFETNQETKQTIVSGMGEMHITNQIDRMKRRYKIDISISEPKVPYRETIKSNSESKYRHKKQSGGAGQFAEVWMRISPKERGEGVEFTESLSGQNVDRGFVPSVSKGVKAVCADGVIAGCKVVDLKADFYDGKMHSVDSNDMAFQIAGRGAFKDAFESAKPYLLEPIYEIEVHVPQRFMGDVMGDISSRRGRVQGMDSDGHFQVIKARVPLANLNKYSTVLRSMTQGAAEHTEKFSHYEEMPRELAQKVVGAYKASREEN